MDCGDAVSGGTAHAGSSRLIDATGEAPHGIADATGTLHLVWQDGQNGTINYCKLPRGWAGGCLTLPHVLQLPPPAIEPFSNQLNFPPFIYRDGSTLYVMQHVGAGARTYVWTGSVNGLFGPPVLETTDGGPRNVFEPGVLVGGDNIVYFSGKVVQGLTVGRDTASSFATLPLVSNPSDDLEDLERDPAGAGAYVATAGIPNGHLAEVPREARRAAGARRDHAGRIRRAVRKAVAKGADMGLFDGRKRRQELLRQVEPSQRDMGFDPAALASLDELFRNAPRRDGAFDLDPATQAKMESLLRDARPSQPAAEAT